MESRVVTRKERLELAGDACLLTAAAFGVFTALVVVISEVATGGSGGLGIGILATALALVAGIGGPVTAWLLHGRRLGLFAIVGAVAGWAAGGVAMMTAPLLAWLFGMVLKPFTTWEFAGALALLVVLAAAFIAMVVWIDIDAVRDLAASRRDHRSLDVARLATTVVLVAFTAWVAVTAVADPSTEFGEAGIFALAAGAAGAVMVTGADAATRLSERKKSDAPTAGDS